MNISLPPELAEFVTQKVASGRYPTASEVIREGLRLLRERDEVQQKKLEELRTAIAIGIQEADQGKVVPFNEETVERIKARGRSRRQQNGPTQRGGTLTRDLSEQPQPACEAQGVPTPTDKLAPAEAERRRLHNLEVRALHAFYRDLAELLKERYRQWVAYHGEQQLGFARTQTELYQECLRRGFQRGEFVVCSIEPADPDFVIDELLPE